jgi:hypothetical protein
LPKYEYCRYRKILGNTGNTSIADTGRFWKIRVIPVLQILEDSGKYWLYQYCRYWKIRYQTLRDHTKYFDITGLLPLILPLTAEMTYEYELYSILLV